MDETEAIQTIIIKLDNTQLKLNTASAGLAMIAITTGELLRSRQINLTVANVYSDILTGIAHSLEKLEKGNGTD